MTAYVALVALISLLGALVGYLGLALHLERLENQSLHLDLLELSARLTAERLGLPGPREEPRCSCPKCSGRPSFWFGREIGQA